MDGKSALKCLDFMEASGQALASAQGLIQKTAQEKTAAGEKIQPLADRLLSEFRLVEAHELGRLQEKLASHAGALDVLNNVLSVYARTVTGYKQKLAVAQGNGSAVPEGSLKQASAGSTGNGDRKLIVLGQRAGLGEYRESDQPLRELAGLA